MITSNSSPHQSNIGQATKKKTVCSAFFSFFKKNKKNKEDQIDQTLDDLDSRLLYSLSPKKIPNWRQLKYVKKVLRPWEKICLNIFILLLVAALLTGGIIFLKKHLKSYPVFGGEYIEGLVGSPRNINPLYDSARDVDSDLSRLIYSSLFKREKDGSIVSDLADEYLVSDNGLEYVVKIKTDVLWHNGENLTAEDVVFTFAAIKNPDYASPLRNAFVNVGVEKIDDYSIKFTLAEAYPNFIELLTSGILPHNLWSNISINNAFLNELNIKPIGSGPYQFKSLSKNKSGDIKEMTLVVNLDYYGPKPYIGKLIFKFYNNYNELVSALNNNELNGLAYLPHSLKSQLVSKKSLTFNSLNLSQITSIFLNSQKNQNLSDLKIRQALSRLIDKNRICDEIFSGNAQVADGPILPGSPSYLENIEHLEYDYEAANNILSEAGWLNLELKASDLFLLKEIIDLNRSWAELLAAGSDTEELDRDLNEKNEALKQIELWEVKKNIVETFAWTDEELIGSWRYKNSGQADNPFKYFSVSLTTVDLADNISVAEFIKAAWSKAGVKTELRIIGAGQVQSEIIRQKNFEALLLSQVIGSDRDVYAFWHSSQISDNGLNISGYKNKEVDKLLEEVRTSLKEEDRIEKYRKFQELLSSDSPVIFLYFPTYNYIQNKKIKGFDFNGILNPADRFNNISYWYIKVNRKIEF